MTDEKTKDIAENIARDRDGNKREQLHRDTVKRMREAIEDRSDDPFGFDYIKQKGRARSEAYSLLLKRIQWQIESIEEGDYEWIGIEYHIAEIVNVIKSYKMMQEHFKKEMEDDSNIHQRVFNILMANNVVSFNKYIVDGRTYEIIDLIYDYDNERYAWNSKLMKEKEKEERDDSIKEYDKDDG